MAPVVEHQQAGVENPFALQGCRADMVDGLVDGGIGVEVGAELDTDGLAPGYDAQLAVLAGKVLCAVEGHVLQEVGQTALAGLLKNGTYALGDVEVGKALLLGIVAQVVGQAVVEVPDTVGRVGR